MHFALPMTDPLKDFEWHTLPESYDDRARRYNPNIEYLDCFNPRPQSERECYLSLCDQVARDLKTDDGISVATYTAIMYWKLYSQRAAIHNICRRIRNDEARSEQLRPILNLFSDEFRDRDPPKEPDAIIDLIHLIDAFAPFGMAATTALPARTTFLHFVYPSVVPIFDKQVLLAVGIDHKDANKDIEVLRQYIPFAWHLTHKHHNTFAEYGYPETPLRLIDMALWVTRSNRP